MIKLLKISDSWLYIVLETRNLHLLLVRLVKFKMKYLFNQTKKPDQLWNTSHQMLDGHRTILLQFLCVYIYIWLILTSCVSVVPNPEAQVNYLLMIITTHQLGLGMDRYCYCCLEKKDWIWSYSVRAKLPQQGGSSFCVYVVVHKCTGW